jgi:hypothetical protein
LEDVKFDLCNTLSNRPGVSAADDERTAIVYPACDGSSRYALVTRVACRLPACGRCCPL